MAVSVTDTRREFKLIPYSGDDEQWPQWVLKFEAWSELVGWGQQLDFASQSTHLIVITTFQVEVQTISKQMYAILVVKLEGKALGIVQLVGKGECAGSVASVEVGVRGQVWEQTSCVAAGNSQPKTWLGG